MNSSANTNFNIRNFFERLELQELVKLFDNFQKAEGFISNQMDWNSSNFNWKLKYNSSIKLSEDME